MSENQELTAPVVKASGEKATPRQIETVANIASKHFKGTCSSYIEIGKDYAFLNAFGRRDRAGAIVELTRLIAKSQESYDAYMASKGTAVSVPAV